MNRTQKAIVPGILFGCGLIILLNQLITPITTVGASAEEPVDGFQGEVNEVESRDECAYQRNYPAGVGQWCWLIEESAAQFGVEPLLIAAVMKVESGGQPQVISHSGAVGLMQVMPRDGVAAGFQCINGPCFSSRPTSAELMEPAFNIMYGTRMLAGLIGQEGSAREALKRYGPADVGYWYADLVLEHYYSLSQ